MKIAAPLFVASIGTASAFVALDSKRKCLPLRMSNRREDDPSNTWSESVTTKMSKSVPFMKCPPLLDGSMAGDAGFDPLGLAKTPQDLSTYREAEIKHARLAMLAAAGWPVSELFDRDIASVFGLDPILDATNRAPSVLNGGMLKISPFYWGFCILAAASIDMYGLSRASIEGDYKGPKKEGYFPGNLGFDPLGMYPRDEAGKKRMQTAEIKNGRIAMIAITAFAAQEFVSEIAVIDQTPIFFRPFTEVLSGYDETPSFFKPITDFFFENANSGYYTPPVETPAFVQAVIPNIDTAVTTSVEAATAVTSPVDAVSAAAATPAVDAVSAVSLEGVTGAPPQEVISTTSVEAVSTVSPPIDNGEMAAAQKRIADLEELVAAKMRIADLEAKLAAIGNISR